MSIDTRFAIGDTVQISSDHWSNGCVGKIVGYFPRCKWYAVKGDGHTLGWFFAESLTHVADEDGMTRYHDAVSGEVCAETTPMEPEIQRRLDEIFSRQPERSSFWMPILRPFTRFFGRSK